MKAVVWTDYGKVSVQDVPEPAPGPHDALVRVEAAAFCKTDIGMIQRGLLDIRPPVIIGHEVAGVVEAVGAEVHGLRIGQRVALDPPVPCLQCRLCRAGLRHMCPNTRHIGAHIPGGMAEFITIDYRNAYPVPDGLSPVAAALAEPFADGLQALSRGGGASGKTVCVFGDGPFGVIICRLARRQDAARVLLFGHHPERMALVHEDDVAVFDPRKVDAGQVIAEATDGYGAEIIIDTTGARRVIEGALDWLVSRGTLVAFTATNERPAIDLDQLHFRELNLAGCCRSLDQFPAALDAMRADADRTDALVTHRLRIEQAHEGFDLIQNSKESTVKAALVF
jgi:threonine dehydrogenase-like Zn-dependent dehydrogenase